MRQLGIILFAQLTLRGAANAIISPFGVGELMLSL